MNVYTYTQPPTPTPAVTISGYSLKGCVSDGTPRALTGYNFYSGSMTAKLCVDTCASRGFSMAGVQ